MEETQVSQSYRQALFEISPTTEKKRKKETRGQWWEWSVKEKEKKGGKKWKKKNLFYYRRKYSLPIYMQNSGEFAIVLGDNKLDT